MSGAKSRLARFRMRLTQARAVRWDVELMQAEAMSVDELQTLNWERRRQLVEHCHRHVPYYQRLFRSIGFEPGDLREPADFERLPILEKRAIRENEDDLVSTLVRKEQLPVSTTGGSTGAPLRTFGEPGLPLSTISWRMLRWWGVEPWMNAGYIYRAIPTGLRKTLYDVALFPTRRVYLSAMDMAAPNMARFAGRLNRIEARYLVGYVGAVDAFARFVEAQGLRFPSLRAVWTTSAPLPELTRSYLQGVLGCPVYTQYGSCEFYFLAAECDRQQGLHIASDVRHVETVPAATGEEGGEGFGDIVATDLTNFAFPLLRYRLGDRGRLLPRACACGRPFPLLDYVRGRVSDNIYLTDGTAIPGEFWTTIFDDFVDAVRAFRVHQQADGAVVIRVEPKACDIAPVLNTVRGRLEARTRGRLTFRFSQEHLGGHDGGKTRFVTSDLQPR